MVQAIKQDRKKKSSKRQEYHLTIRMMLNQGKIAISEPQLQAVINIQYARSCWTLLYITIELCSDCSPSEANTMTKTWTLIRDRCSSI